MHLDGLLIIFHLSFVSKSTCTYVVYVAWLGDTNHIALFCVNIETDVQ